METKAKTEAHVREVGDSAIINHGDLFIEELVTGIQSPNLSVSIVEIKGTGDCVRNMVSTANYFIYEGSGTFSLEIDGVMQDFPVTAGSSVFIPKGTWFQDRGNMKMLSAYSPAFDLLNVERR